MPLVSNVFKVWCMAHNMISLSFFITKCVYIIDNTWCVDYTKVSYTNMKLKS